jgi:nicotinamidase-related amidase
MVTLDIDPTRTALLVVDLQRCFVDDSPVAAPERPAVVRRLTELAAVCREQGVGVLHTRHVVRPDHSNAGLLAEVVPAAATV